MDWKPEENIQKIEPPKPKVAEKKKIETFQTTSFKKLSLPNVIVKNRGINECFADFLKEARQMNGGFYDPTQIFNKMASMFHQFRGHSQQDAQEFLRFFLDALVKSEAKVSQNEGKNEGKNKEKTFVESLFGGYLCNYCIIIIEII